MRSPQKAVRRPRQPRRSASRTPRSAASPCHNNPTAAQASRASPWLAWRSGSGARKAQGAAAPFTRKSCCLLSTDVAEALSSTRCGTQRSNLGTVKQLQLQLQLPPSPPLPPSPLPPAAATRHGIALEQPRSSSPCSTPPLALRRRCIAPAARLRAVPGKQCTHGSSQRTLQRAH
jgi:hypothetical protein